MDVWWVSIRLVVVYCIVGLEKIWGFLVGFVVLDVGILIWFEFGLYWSYEFWGCLFF